jgi:hypothetical protein
MKPMFLFYFPNPDERFLSGDKFHNTPGAFASHKPRNNPLDEMWY